MNTHDGLINGTICTLKYVEYINQQSTVRPNILWVHFSDMTVGIQQRRKYKMFYHEGISFCWTPIFAACQQFFVGNAKGESVCIDMDVSSSEKLAKNPEKPKNFINMHITLLQVVLGH